MTARILIVDDEPFVRGLVQETLELGGYETELAENGRQALDVLEERDVDLVLTDVVMPEIPGLELLRAIKKTWPRMKVIVLTGYAQEHDITQFLLHGADEYLSKPFQVKELLEAVSRTLSGASKEEDG